MVGATPDDLRKPRWPPTCGERCRTVDAKASQIRLPPLEAPGHPYAIPGTHFAVIGTGNPVSQPIESLNVNQPQFGRLRPLADQTAFPAPPPAILCMPIIAADRATGLVPELTRLLGGPGG